ncbi:MAG: serpin family protein [Syntrophorhabdaceae bacterium]
MKCLFRLLPYVLTAVFCLLATITLEASASAQLLKPNTNQQNLANGNTEFAVQLYQGLSASEGNLFFSPFSISSALGMTYAGACGNTANEIARALRFGLGQTELHTAFRNLNKELNTAVQKSGQKLNIANALVLTGGNVSQDFKSILKNDYDAEIFSGGLGAVNGWVKNKTEGKIEKILEELSPNSVCVLLNAIYFKGIWESQFNKASTHDAFFHVSATKKLKVPLMYQKSNFRILMENDFQALSVPYKGESLSMVVLLPNGIDGLATLEKNLTIEKLGTWLKKLDKQKMQKVKLYLPKFKLETKYDLVPNFREMGMKDAFGTAADFTGMGWKKGDLWISQIKHRAFVDVNEEGTEAAAVTAVEMETKSVDLSPTFRADHPFLFIIRDNRSGSILFMGRMVNPA